MTVVVIAVVIVVVVVVVVVVSYVVFVSVFMVDPDCILFQSPQIISHSVTILHISAHLEYSYACPP